MIPKAPYADCEECPLREQGAVHGRGPERADIVVIGEAPGKQEVATGIPFTGKSGKLMDRVLSYHGIRRDDVYVTNAVLCRPEGNRTPTAVELRHCRERLVHEVKSRNPSKILALGAVAAKDVLATKDGISILRIGGAKYSEELAAHVVPTFHPAAALRNPDLFPSIVSDVRKIKQAHIKVGWEATKYKVVDDPIEAQWTLHRQATKSSLLTVDIELGKPYTRTDPNWLCIGVSARPGTAVVYTKRAVESGYFQQAFEKVCQDANVKLGWQNGKFDIQFLWSFAPSARVDEDTMLAHYATDERKGTHDLEQLATEILGAPFYKQEAKKALGEDKTLEFLPPDVLYQYNATDADVTNRLLDPLHDDMASDGVIELYTNLLIPGANALADVEQTGVKVDLDELDKFEEQFTAEALVLEEGLKEWVENPRSPKQVIAAFANLGYEIASSDKQTLSGIPHEFAKRMLAYRAKHKLLSTYVHGLRKFIGDDGRVHSTFLLHGTESGRLSSRRPNLQNIPIEHGMRNVFIPSSEDRVLMNADYGAIEFRLAAIFSGDEWLLEQFRNNRSLHDEVARDLFGDKHTERQYIIAKSTNFGILYGESAAHLGARLGIAVRQAQRMIDAFFARSPGLAIYRKKIQQDILERGYIESHFGRKRRFWLVTYDNKHDVFKEGYNFPLQSTASDMTLRSFIKLNGILKDYDAKPIITVHDSLVLDVAKEALPDVAQVVRSVMEDTEFEIPFPVEVTYGPRWGIKEGEL